MNVSRALETAKIAIHWNHFIAPTDPESGKDQEISWKGTAQRIAGIVILAISSALIGAFPTMMLFSVAIPYYTYTAYEKTAALAEDQETPPAKQPLSDKEIENLNQLGIDAIKKANAEGKKVGLIIGRCKEQPVPVEKGWLWVAGNICGDPEVLENRVDLQMDFSEIETMNKLQDLFDRVVVDFSTLKFLDGWRTFVPMLKDTPESQLVTETTKGCFGIGFDIDVVRVNCEQGSLQFPASFLMKERAENKRLFAEWKAQVGATESEEQKARFIEQMSASEKEDLIRFGGEEQLEKAFFHHILNKHYPNRYSPGQEAVREGVEKFRHYLGTLFNRVEVYDDHVPFPTRQGLGYAEKAAHFVLTGPKK